MRAPFSVLLAAIIFTAAIGCEAKNDAAPPIRPAPQSSKTAAPPKENGDVLSIDEMRAEALKTVDQEGCRERGGVVRQAGMLGMPRCVTPYSDAGKVCRDSAECEGRCLSDDAETDHDAPAGELTGLCEADDSPFGCYAEIVDGASRGFLCVD